MIYFDRSKNKIHVRVGDGMIGAGIGAIAIAGILSWFGFDDMVRTAINELFHLQVTNATYYFGFFVLGAISTLFRPRKVECSCKQEQEVEQ